MIRLEAVWPIVAKDFPGDPPSDNFLFGFKIQNSKFKSSMYFSGNKVLMTFGKLFCNFILRLTRFSDLPNVT